MPQGADAAQPPEVEPPMPEPLLEVPVVAPERPIPAPEPATVLVARAEPPEAEPVAAGEPAVPADPAPARDLHDITLRFWQDQLERIMATGQAIMLCRSPQEAVRLQVTYIQATLASGYAHAGEVAACRRISRATCCRCAHAEDGALRAATVGAALVAASDVLVRQRDRPDRGPSGARLGLACRPLAKVALTRIGVAAPPVWAFHGCPKSTIIQAMELPGVHGRWHEQSSAGHGWRDGRSDRHQDQRQDGQTVFVQGPTAQR
jgi:hypothetical protein